MRGFYRNKYTTPDGSETRYGASTQFEVENKHLDLFLIVNRISFSLQIVVEHFHVGMSQISKRHLI